MSQQGGELLCQRCDRDYVVWFAPNDVWNTVVRGGQIGGREDYAFLCPNCFTFLATVVNGYPAAWEIRQETFAKAGEPTHHD